MNRAMKLTLLVIVLLVASSGVAYALTCQTHKACWGNNGPNWMDGSNGPDRMYGLGGADDFYASNGNDKVYGGSGSDSTLDGDNGNDLIYGGPGNDEWIFGSNGADTMYGPKGHDELAGWASPDKMYGGFGNDSISASVSDGSRDIVRGGPGFDECYVNRFDVVRGCEQRY